MVHSDPATQRQDLLRLLALIEDPHALAEQLSKAERRWLRRAEQRLDVSGRNPLEPEAARRAALAYRLLLREA